MRPASKSDRAQFLEALALWDRPSDELYGRAFDADVDVDSFVDAALSSAAAGILRE